MAIAMRMAWNSKTYKEYPRKGETMTPARDGQVNGGSTDEIRIQIPRQGE